jgi:hypothetical protein
MVNDMGVDDTVEQVAADEAKVSVSGCERTLDEGPVLGIIMRQLRVVVVQVGDSDYSHVSSARGCMSPLPRPELHILSQ